MLSATQLSPTTLSKGALTTLAPKAMMHRSQGAATAALETVTQDVVKVMTEPQSFVTEAKSLFVGLGHFNFKQAAETALLGTGLKSVGSFNRVRDAQLGVVDRPVPEQIEQEGAILGTIAAFSFIFRGFMGKTSSRLLEFGIMLVAYEMAEKLSRGVSHAYDHTTKAAEAKNSGNSSNNLLSTALHTSALPGSLDGAAITIDSKPAPPASRLLNTRAQTFRATPFTQASLNQRPSKLSNQNPAFSSSFYPFEFKPACGDLSPQASFFSAARPGLDVAQNPFLQSA